jgi:hypothetical protein
VHGEAERGTEMFSADFLAGEKVLRLRARKNLSRRADNKIKI